MAEGDRWNLYDPAQAFLVALDISGFSRHMEKPNQLLAHRERLFRAVEKTQVFAQAKQAGTVVVHFLGDELRLAFLSSVGVRAVNEFVDAVMVRLDEEQFTRVKGIVFTGVVSWEEWRGCTFLDGRLPFQAQQWMEQLSPGEIAADEGFKKALTNNAIPTSHLQERSFRGTPGYLLRGRA